jgi:hypothetical protein
MRKMAASKSFTVKSVYEFLSKEESGISYRRVWKAKIPEKIKKNYMPSGAESHLN